MVDVDVVCLSHSLYRLFASLSTSLLRSRLYRFDLPCPHLSALSREKRRKPKNRESRKSSVSLLTRSTTSVGVCVYERRGRKMEKGGIGTTKIRRKEEEPKARFRRTRRGQREEMG